MEDKIAHLTHVETFNAYIVYIQVLKRIHKHVAKDEMCIYYSMNKQDIKSGKIIKSFRRWNEYNI